MKTVKIALLILSLMFILGANGITVPTASYVSVYIFVVIGILDVILRGK